MHNVFASPTGDNAGALVVHPQIFAAVAWGDDETVRAVIGVVRGGASNW